MQCSRCAEESRRGALRQFWQEIPNADKRQFTTGLVALAGASAGCFANGILGALVGVFLGGCIGGIAGLARFEPTSKESPSQKQLTGPSITR